MGHSSQEKGVLRLGLISDARSPARSGDTRINNLPGAVSRS